MSSVIKNILYLDKMQNVFKPEVVRKIII